MACDSGRYSDDGKVCNKCRPGYFCPEEGLTMGKICPDGKYTDKFGETDCKTCMDGSTCIKGGLSSCPAGFNILKYLAHIVLLVATNCYVILYRSIL